MKEEPMNIYPFEVRETTVRDAHVMACSLNEAQRMMREYAAGGGDAGMGDDAPVQLGDMRTVRLTFRRSLYPIERQGRPVRRHASGGDSWGAFETDRGKSA